MSDETTPENGEIDETVSTETAETGGAPSDAATEDAQARDPLEVLQEENGQLKDQLMRALAETDNVRKRGEKQAASERAYAIEKFAKDLLSVSDNMARALEALSDEGRAALSEHGQKLLEGIELTQKELHAVLARNGVAAIDAEPGASFDPNAHQAVSQIPSEHPSGSVAALFQSGWKIGDRTLRAAMVAVSSGAPAAPSPTPEQGPEGEPGDIVDTTA